MLYIYAGSVLAAVMVRHSTDAICAHVISLEYVIIPRVVFIREHSGFGHSENSRVIYMIKP